MDGVLDKQNREFERSNGKPCNKIVNRNRKGGRKRTKLKVGHLECSWISEYSKIAEKVSLYLFWLMNTWYCDQFSINIILTTRQLADDKRQIRRRWWRRMGKRFRSNECKQIDSHAATDTESLMNPKEQQQNVEAKISMFSGFLYHSMVVILDQIRRCWDFVYHHYHQILYIHTGERQSSIFASPSLVCTNSQIRS